MRKLERVVVVEDDAVLRGSIARVVESWGLRAEQAATAAEARSMLAGPPGPDLMIVDVHLPDDTAFELIEETRALTPAPIVVVMSGKASPDEAFRLAQQGVRAYLAKPLSLDELEQAVMAACAEPPSLEPLISASVGHIPMRELQRQVRSVMVKEALALASGSRSGAARLLEVSRQAVQQIVRGQPGAGGDSVEPSDRPPPVGKSTAG